MLSDERRRNVLHALSQSIGSEPAHELMSMLPAADHLTRADLDAGMASLRGEMGELRGEIGDLRGELRGGMGELRGEMGELRGQMAGIHHRIDAQLSRLITANAATVGIAIAIVTAIVR